MRVELTVNNTLYQVDVSPTKRLLDVLREDLGLKGSKEGCGEGECGACSVLVDGQLVNACLIPVMQVTGAEILTIEGLCYEEQINTLQQAFLDQGAVHCGFCTPGMVMASHALLSKIPTPTREQIQEGLSGNICRCTGYEKICTAVEDAVAKGYSQAIPAGENLCLGESAFTPEEEGRYFIPTDLNDALHQLAKHPDLTLLAGSTDIAPDIKTGKREMGSAMDIFRLKELKEITLEGGEIRIGAGVTNTELMESDLVKKQLPALRYCASRCGAPAIQNRATIGGNIVTASGAGDLPVVLHALDARVCLASLNGERELPLNEFVLGYRKCAFNPGELLKEIRIPLPQEGSLQKFYKRGSRKALTLSRVSIAFHLLCEEGRIKEFRAAAGSMSPTPQRLHGMEEALIGHPLDQELSKKAAKLAQECVNPRKSSEYRKSIVYNLTKRFFDELEK